MTEPLLSERDTSMSFVEMLWSTVCIRFVILLRRTSKLSCRLAAAVLLQLVLFKAERPVSPKLFDMHPRSVEHYSDIIPLQVPRSGIMI